MKILHVCETVLGGTGAHLNELIPYQHAHLQGGDVKLLCPQQHLIQIPNIPPALIQTFNRPSRLLGLPLMLIGFVRLYASFRPDIIHLHSTFAGALLRLITPFLGAAVIYCPHGWAMNREQPHFLRYLYAWIERCFVKVTSRIVAVSEHERLDGIKNGIPPNKISTIYNGLCSNTPAFNPVVWNDTRLKVLFVGRLDRDKGVDILLIASQPLNEKVAVRVIGGAVIEKTTFSLTDYPHAEFLGWMDAASIVPHMAACDVVVIPSRWEGFGYVAAEAMRLSKPIFAARVGGLQELVIDGKTGQQFEIGDAAALQKLLEKADKTTLQQMGEEGRRHFLQHFTVDSMGKATLGLYRDMLKAKQ